MVITQINNIWAKCDPQSINHLRDFLSYEAEYWIQGPWGKQRKKYTKHLVGKTNGAFFAGFIPMVIEKFPDAELRFRHDNLLYKTKTISELGNKKLRPYQINMVEDALKIGRGVLKAPTGAGKTLIEGAVIASMTNNIRVLVIVHTKTLLVQIRNELAVMFKQPIGIIGDGKKNWLPITVGMIQTLSRMPNSELKQKKIDIIIVDECHHCKAQSYSNVLTNIDAPFRFGFSATPKERKDDEAGYMIVTGLLGDIISEATYKDVEDYLAIPKVKFLTYYTNWGLENLSWRSVYKLGIEISNNRNNLIYKTAMEHRDKSVLILLKTLRHGFSLEALFKDNDIPITFVKGEDDTASREKAKRVLKNKGIVIATSVFGEGVDIPSLDVIINAGAGLSRIQTVQRAGRALRKIEGKTEGIIIDFMDEGNKYLTKHSKARYETYLELGWIKEEEDAKA